MKVYNVPPIISLQHDTEFRVTVYGMMSHLHKRLSSGGQYIRCGTGVELNISGKKCNVRQCLKLHYGRLSYLHLRDYHCMGLIHQAICESSEKILNIEERLVYCPSSVWITSGWS